MDESETLVQSSCCKCLPFLITSLSVLFPAGVRAEGSEVLGGQTDRGYPRNCSADLHHQRAAVAVCDQPGAHRGQKQQGRLK